jgi:hypothetical protein
MTREMENKEYTLINNSHESLMAEMLDYKQALRLTNEQLKCSSNSLLSWIMNPTISSTKQLLYIVYHPSYAKEVESQVVALDSLFL